MIASALVLVAALAADAGVDAEVDVDAGSADAATVDVAPPPPPPPPPPPVATTPRLERPIDVVVTGHANPADRLRQSAEAVTVVDTRKAKQRSADLGEVLARTQGVAVRREGGLGSNTRFSLNGLYDDQIRFFLDGVPLDTAGFPLGVANVPVNLIERVEIYRGVVPIRFGADALGGVVNLVTDPSLRTRLAASYQVGSFGTHRATVDGLYRHVPTGLVAGGSAFVDLARNDYWVDVDFVEPNGRLTPLRTRRFHDRYEAQGASVQVGLVERPLARRLLLTGFFSRYAKDIQNDPLMSVPYGEARTGQSDYGATARYEASLGARLDLSLVATYTRSDFWFLDRSPWIYDWLGRRVSLRPEVGRTGEIVAYPSDQVAWQDVGVGRAVAAWKLAEPATLRASITPRHTARSGDERLFKGANGDPLNARSTLRTVVSGLELELTALGGRLSNLTFAKDYLYRAEGVDPFEPEVRVVTDSHTVGAGDSARLRLTPWLLVKGSYEYATRLPTAYEALGDLAMVDPNPKLLPELSHNVNVGPRADVRRPTLGVLAAEVSAFFRESQRFIVATPIDRRLQFDNVYGARTVGVEAASTWTSPRGLLGLDATGTWQDQRVSSDQGEYGRFKGQRLPNRPWLFASWGARVLFRGLPGADDRLEAFYNGRYVHSFFFGWDFLGQRDLKRVIPAQVTHGAGLTWVVQRAPGRLTATAELTNLTDAQVYDNFGAQRPGRAFYLKLTGEL